MTAVKRHIVQVKQKPKSCRYVEIFLFYMLYITALEGQPARVAVPNCFRHTIISSLESPVSPLNQLVTSS
jgi:hypothetical protein